MNDFTPLLDIQLNHLSRETDELADYWSRSEMTLGADHLATLPASLSPELPLLQQALHDLQSITQRLFYKRHAYEHLRRFHLRARRWRKACPFSSDREAEKHGMHGMNALEKYLLAQNREMPEALHRQLPDAEYRVDGSFRLHRDETENQGLSPQLRTFFAVDYTHRWNLQHYEYDEDNHMQTDNFSPWNPKEPAHPWPDVHFSWLLWTIWDSPGPGMSDLHLLPVAERRDNPSLYQEIAFDTADLPTEFLPYQETLVLRACVRNTAKYLVDRISGFKTLAQNIEEGSHHLLQQARGTTPFHRSLRDHLKTMARFARNRLRHVKKFEHALSEWHRQYDPLIATPANPPKDERLEALALRNKLRIDAEGERWTAALRWMQGNIPSLECLPMLEVDIRFKTPEALDDIDDNYENYWDGSGRLSDLIPESELPWIETIFIYTDWIEHDFIRWENLSPEGRLALEQ